MWITSHYFEDSLWISSNSYMGFIELLRYLYSCLSLSLGKFPVHYFSTYIPCPILFSFWTSMMYNVSVLMGVLQVPYSVHFASVIFLFVLTWYFSLSCLQVCSLCLLPAYPFLPLNLFSEFFISVLVLFICRISFWFPYIFYLLIFLFCFYIVFLIFSISSFTFLSVFKTFIYLSF